MPALSSLMERLELDENLCLNDLYLARLLQGGKGKGPRDYLKWRDRRREGVIHVHPFELASQSCFSAFLLGICSFQSLS